MLSVVSASPSPAALPTSDALGALPCHRKPRPQRATAPANRLIGWDDQQKRQLRLKDD
jgi:hypothetical protein